MRHPAAMVVMAAIVAVGSSFVHPFGNPRVVPAQGRGTLLVHAAMPPEAKQILIRKCADCHSNETRWPVYAHLAPGSWLIERDIVQARRKMNLSNWDRMTSESQEAAFAEIAHEARGGDMPPLQYRSLHWTSKLIPAEVATLSLMQNASQSQAGAAGTGDAARGEAVFQKRCTGCHALEGNREGPALAGVFDRKAATVAGFDYSAGLKKSGFTWEQTTLEKWLSDPDLVVPDNKMGVGVPKAQERSDIIAYFKSQR